MTGGFGDFPFGEQPKHRIYPRQPGEPAASSSHAARRLSRTPRGVRLFAKRPLPSAHSLRVPPSPLQRARGLLERFGCFPRAVPRRQPGKRRVGEHGAGFDARDAKGFPRARRGGTLHRSVSSPCRNLPFLRRKVPPAPVLSGLCNGLGTPRASLYLPARWRCGVFLPGSLGCVR